MPIPPFDMRGLMPAFLGSDETTVDRSPYWTTMSELATVLGTTPHRRQLLRNLIGYRALIATDAYQAGFQFIDGSFVENIEATASRSPGDIDVFSILHAPAKYHGPHPSWGSSGVHFWFNEIVDRAKNKHRFSLDTYAVLFEELNPIQFIQYVIYWYSLFSHQKVTLAWKGFAALQLDPADDQAALAALGSS